jgi:peptide/nickel transport system permease protein
VTRYLLKRLGILVVIVFIVSVGTFFLLHLLPGDPTITILGPADTSQNRAILLKQLGLNKPVIEQYATWIWNVVRGNLGQSFTTHQSVVSIIAAALPIDVELIVLSQIMALIVAVPLALLAARRPNKALDRYSTATTFALLAAPAYVIAPLLLYAFAIKLHWFPGPSTYTVGGSFWTNLHALILPAIILAVGSIVVYYRILRNDLIATLQEDFIMMARSKGLSDRRVLISHALRPSSLSLLASAGLTISSLLAGAFVVEFLFQLPGLGYELIYSINQRDYLVVQGLVLTVAVAVLVINFSIDLLYSFVDPRVSRD